MARAKNTKNCSPKSIISIPNCLRHILCIDNNGERHYRKLPVLGFCKSYDLPKNDVTNIVSNFGLV